MTGNAALEPVCDPVLDPALDPALDLDPVLDISRVTATHGRGAQMLRVLAETNLAVHRGESVAVTGASGAGKSTLADIVLGLRAPAGGRVSVLGRIWAAPGRRPDPARRRLVQGVPQDPAASFVPRWTIRHSIAHAIARLGAGERPEALIRRSAELAHLDPDLLDHRPAELSGGQAQRAAIARALAVGPAVLVADEPTSALDAETAVSVSNALLSSAAESGIALLLVTHDPALAERCTRILPLTPPAAAE